MTLLEIVALWFLVSVAAFAAAPAIGMFLNRFLKIEDFRSKE